MTATTMLDRFGKIEAAAGLTVAAGLQRCTSHSKAATTCSPLWVRRAPAPACTYCICLELVLRTELSLNLTVCLKCCCAQALATQVHWQQLTPMAVLAMLLVSRAVITPPGGGSLPMALEITCSSSGSSNQAAAI
jgi:hypothetical protein